MLAYYYGIINVVTLLVWGIDKYRAKMSQWRIPERWLVTLILAGGSFGALVGMLLFRHKTRKLHFWILVGMGCLNHGLVIFYVVNV